MSDPIDASTANQWQATGPEAESSAQPIAAPIDRKSRLRLPLLLAVALGLLIVLVAHGFWTRPPGPPQPPERSPQQEDIAAKVERLGGEIVFDFDLDGQPVVGVSLRAAQITDADLAVLEEVPELKRLWLDDTKTADAGLARLAGLASLELVHLANTLVTDQGLESLRGMPNLTILALDGTGVTDGGLAHLKGLRDLTMISLEKTKVTDAGLEHLKGLVNLRLLELGGTRVTEAGVERLQKALPEASIYR